MSAITAFKSNDIWFISIVETRPVGIYKGIGASILIHSDLRQGIHALWDIHKANMLARGSRASPVVRTMFFDGLDRPITPPIDKLVLL